MFGISIGLAGVIVLAIIVRAEYSFDRFHADADKIFRLQTVFVIDGQETRFAITDAFLDVIMENDVPNIEASTAFYRSGPIVLRVGDKIFSEPGGLAVDKDFLSVFSFKTIAGKKSLSEPNEIALTESLAIKLFGTTDVVGRIVDYDQGGGVKQPMKVVLVMEDTPINSTIQFDFLFSGSTWGEWWSKMFRQGSESNAHHVYFKLQNEEPLQTLQSKLDTAFDFTKMKSPTYAYFTPVQPLTDIHFNSPNQFELRPATSLDAFRIYVVLIISILVIVVLNAANMNSARLVKRVKGIGVSKVFGATRRNIFVNCMADLAVQNLITFSIAAILATAVIYTLDLSVFLIDKSAPILFIASWYFVALYLGYSILTSIYPIWRVNAYRIQRSIAGKVDTGTSKYFGPRYVLVTLQVIAASTMVVFSITIARQIRHIRATDLGYTKENLIEFKIPGNASFGEISRFKYLLEQSTTFSSVGSSFGELLGPHGMGTTRFKNPGEEGFMAAMSWVDHDYIKTMDMTIVEGRGFSDNFKKDSLTVVINEAARHTASLNVGDELLFYPNWYKVIGVVKDFNYRGFDKVISPAVFFLTPYTANVVMARYGKDDDIEALSRAKAAWQQSFGNSEISYRFFEDKFNDLVNKELQTAYVAIFFSIVTLCIACIGVLGLTAYIVVNYSKTIAIRKIMGATTGDILTLFGKRFLIITIVGSIVAVPIVIELANYWLSHFIYKTPLVFTDFLLTFVLIAMLVVVVISRQVLQSSSANPADAIREE
ncbi:MAG TPA: ABC transporter permease [Cyclobacteriaceae bacterium]|nr:ABC transporter permease [Cyclobacteriaceae bacterium]